MIGFTQAIIQAILVALIAGYIGQRISSTFQKESFLNQIQIRNAEDEIKRITELGLRIAKAVSERRFALQNLVDELSEHNSSNNEEVLRKEYRDSVKKWNEELQAFNIELSSIGLSEQASYLENEIHKNFRSAHDEIKIFMENRKYDSHLRKTIEYLNAVNKKTNELISTLSNKAKTKKDSILNGNTENLSINNLENATNWQLIIAIFHASPNKLRITRSF